MGVKHQLILGVILIWTLYISQGTATEVNSTTVGNTIEDVTQRNVNLIEKLPKTDTEQRDVYSNTHDSTTIKINLTTHDPSTSNNVNTTSLEITTPSIKKENVIKKDGIGKGREDNTRSIDLEKYVSPEFQNNVFTPNFSDTEKYFDFKSSTEKSSSFSDFDLTTPKSDLFDIRFKEVSEGVRQKLEQDFDDNQNDNDHDTDDGNEHEHDDLHDDDDDKNDDEDEMQVDKLLEEPKIIQNTTLDYKEMKNIIVKNNTDGKMSTHNNVIVEKVKRVNVESNFNDTKTYDYDSKDDMEITSAKHDLPTTRKPINLTKPPNNENISDILNNKIETGPIKAIISTTEFTATKRTGDNEQVSRESQLEKQVLPFNVTTEGTVNLPSTSTAEAMTTTSTTTGKEEITTLSEATSVKDESTTVETKTEPITVAIMSNNFTTEITDIPSTTFDSGTSSTTIIDETTVTIYTESTTTESTSFIPTTQYIDITTITDESITEDVTKASELLTTEDIAIILTTKRSQNYFESQDIGNKSSTVPVTETTTMRSTTTTSQPETTIKTIVYTSSASSEAIEATDIRNTTVSTFAFSPTFVPVIPTTQGIAFRNDLATEEFTEMSYATETSVSPQEPEDGEGNKKAVVIAISTVAAICLILLAGLLYIMRKRQKRFNYKQRCRPVSLDDYSVDNVSAYNSVRRKGADRQSKRSYGNPAFDDPSAPSHPLNFPALAKFASNIDDIKLEFDDIPQITAKTSELPDGCEPKNRYANVIPLPETRVSLKTIEGYPNSDYINANYVIGPKKTKGFYIACQAPMQNTVDDFWRMIWEQQTKVILMVTHFFENGVEKCVDYLPPSEVLDCHRLFGDFQVTLKKRDVKEKYIISSLQLKNMVSNSWREVTHFWYLGWPEKGIPVEANSLIAFLIEARSFMKTSTLDRNAVANGTNSLPRTDVNPVVVHCSPGTGRTGVVMACDIAIREFEQTRLVDIPKIVYMIRRDRANAVQTKEQYIFIYKVVSLYATKLTGGALESL